MSRMREVRLVAAGVGRKARMLARRLPRFVRRVKARRGEYERRPPVVVTTVPKSGTHLVQQIVTALPGTVDYGTFLATRVSYRRRERSRRAHLRRIRALAPGEILRAHLNHGPEIVAALRKQGAFVVFVHRDPRDVVVSEAHYLADLAPWNALHRPFAKRTPAERIDLAIDGLPGDGQLYPDVGTRFQQHAGWLDDADVVLRFEDLVSERRRDAIRGLVAGYRAAAGASFDVDEITDRALAAIDPSRSHTFRAGQVGAFRTEFTAEQLERFEAVGGRALARFGYRSSFEDAGVG